jgi:UDP-3-O-[3-hydroxymyristoyl] glucosamine N-acyltransferase
VADPAFYRSRGPFSISQIERLARCRFEGRDDARTTLVYDVSALDAAGLGQAAYCERPKFISQLKASQATVCFVPAAMAREVPAHVLALVTTTPQLSFCALADALYPDAGLLWDSERPPLTSVDSSARIGTGAMVAPGCFIGADVEIGANCVIGPGSVLGRGVKLGAGCWVGAQVTIAYAFLGDRVRIMAGTRVGSDGFGYAPGPRGLIKVPQLGRVIVQDDVEIGANCTIDRGALSDTVIGEGTKLDNMVHVAHNVMIGRHCVIAAQSGISGSSRIGDFVMMGGQTGVADHVTIGDKSQIAGRGGITRDLAGGQVYGGFPARPVRQWRREVAAVARLAKSKRGSDHDSAE